MITEVTATRHPQRIRGLPEFLAIVILLRSIVSAIIFREFSVERFLVSIVNTLNLFNTFSLLPDCALVQHQSHCKCKAVYFINQIIL